MAKPVFKTTSKKAPTYRTAEAADGEYLFREGELGREMFIIQEGQIEILKTIQGEEESLAVFEKGDFFGEMALLEDLPRIASARALGPSKLIVIDGATFDQMLRNNPEIAVRMMRKLSRRLRETDRLLKQLRRGAEDELAMVEEPSETELDAPKKGPERLVHEPSGMEFFLTHGLDGSVGRKDPVTGIHPDVDLSPVDSQRSTSRQHAKLYHRNEAFYVSEEIGTMNGTFVNGERIETGVPVVLEDGDEVQFGLVKLVFRAT